MGLAFQLHAVSDAQLAEADSDPSVLQALLDDRYMVDVDGEAVWLDKSGMGILEALGVMLPDDPQNPAAWVLGKEALPIGDSVGLVDAASVHQVAALLDGITDSDFRERAASNVMDNDVEYLTPYFAQLRGFYRAAADRGAAVLARMSG